MSKVLRTPDHQFENLPDYDFSPNYVEIDDVDLGAMRLHYVDHGQKDAPTVIMMHGEPSWSYLYRKMITQVSNAGYRVLAPDLIGFGRSDKPAKTDDYSYSKHVAWMTQWLDLAAPKNCVLFCQDWGGLIGLRLVATQPERFDGVIAGNTFLPTGDRDPGQAFKDWKAFSLAVPECPTGGVIRGATVKPLGVGVEAAYDAPYPDESYKAGARIFPSLVPISPEMDGAADNVEAWKVLRAFEKPFLTCFSDQDPITKVVTRFFKNWFRVPKGNRIRL